jgi:DNA-binding XRE family transcriptional regulator
MSTGRIETEPIQHALASPNGPAAIALIRDCVRSGKAREIRVAAGLSLADVGRAVGVSAPCIALWETGQRIPRSAAALKYGQVLVALMERS